MSRPSIFAFEGRAKWDAWKSAGEVWGGREADAEARYKDIAASLGWKHGETASGPSPPSPTAEDLLSRDGNSLSSDDGGMGLRVSSMSAPFPDVGLESEPPSLHGLAIAGDLAKFLAFLDDHSGVNLNEKDEYVNVHVSVVSTNIKFCVIGIYPSSSRRGPRKCFRSNSSLAERCRHIHQGQ